MNSVERKLHNVLGHSWYTKLQHLFQTEEIEKVYANLRELLQLPSYPKSEDYFKAFRLCGFEDTKVVILNPYPYPFESGDGLAFSFTDPFSKPAPLEEILKEIARNTPENKPAFGELSHLANQGVLLLNLELSVHVQGTQFMTPGWRYVTHEAIRMLAHKEPCVFMLWGDRVRLEFMEITKGIDLSQHKILTAPYPSTTTDNGETFAGCNHFNEANVFLKSHYNLEIRWH